MIMEVAVSPPRRGLNWDFFKVALEVVYSSDYGVSERTENNEGFFLIVERFKECLDSLEACMNSDKAPYGYVLGSPDTRSLDYPISCTDVNGKIIDFSRGSHRNYFSVFNDLKVATLKILEGINPASESGKIFEEFARYVTR